MSALKSGCSHTTVHFAQNYSILTTRTPELAKIVPEVLKPLMRLSVRRFPPTSNFIRAVMFFCTHFRLQILLGP